MMINGILVFPQVCLKDVAFVYGSARGHSRDFSGGPLACTQAVPLPKKAIGTEHQ